MKKIFSTLVIVCFLSLPMCAAAQDPITLIIKAAIKKAVLAADLRIQRLQNKTITLQNAQKRTETVMSREKLEAINDWVAEQKSLYEGYYNELLQVRSIVRDYEGVKKIVQMGGNLLKEYQNGVKEVSRSSLLSPAEKGQMARVYKGMLDKSLELVNTLSQLLEPGVLEMSDRQRLHAIASIEEEIQETIDDLRGFGAENGVLLRQRAAEIGSIRGLKKAYNH